MTEFKGVNFSEFKINRENIKIDHGIYDGAYITLDSDQRAIITGFMVRLVTDHSDNFYEKKES